MLQIIPIALLAAVFLLDLVNALVGVLSNFEILPELGQWTNILGTALSLLATLISAVLLATKKFSSLALGFMVTLLCALSSAVFATWTASWFLP
ncbi:hypothetical protein [Synechococcus sp. HK01-R]|jgi:hypothetical protein|uniref:hypothetical protein n=1 Tax=Synechococcus sp. HK01-R TaxID=2751171 RepID=UPI0016249441|nr:hypothetical protein [Synechococcus sp. HK01-R]QNG27503.1 hypothetical protein H0O21_02435 [Synechococcus sp. HK01-R]